MKRGLEWAANLVLRTPQRLTNGENSTPIASPTTEPRNLSFSPSPNAVPPRTPQNLRQILDKNFQHFVSKAIPETRNEVEEISNEGLKAVVRVNRTIATGASSLIPQQSLESNRVSTPAVPEQIENQTPAPSHHQDSTGRPKVRPFKGGWPGKANLQTRPRTLADVDRPGLRFAPAPIPAPDRKTGKTQSSSRFFRTNSFDAIPEQPRSVFARPQSASIIPSLQKSDQPTSRPKRQTLAETSIAIHQAREEQLNFERQAKRPKLGTGETPQKASDVEPNETRPNVRVRRFVKKREFVQPRSSRNTNNLHSEQAEPKKDPAPGDPDFIPRLHLKPMSETAKKILEAFDNGEWDKEQQQKKAMALENAPPQDLGPPSISLQEKLPKTIQGIRTGTPTIGPYFTKRQHEESQENIEKTVKPTIKKARKTGKYGLPSDSEDEELAEPSTPDTTGKESPFKALPPRPKEQGSELKSFLKNVEPSGPHQDFDFGKAWPLGRAATVTSPKRPLEEDTEQTTAKKLKGEQIEKSNGPEKVVRKPAPVVSSWGAEFLAKNKRQQESATKAAEAFINNTDGKEDEPSDTKPAFIKFGVPPKTAQKTNESLVGSFQTDVSEPEKQGVKFGVPLNTNSDKPAFQFGIPLASSDQPAFKFGVHAAKESEKPGIKFGVPSTKSSEPLKAEFKFGVPASIPGQDIAKPAFDFRLPTQIVAETAKKANSPLFAFNEGSKGPQQPLSLGTQAKESTSNLGTQPLSNFQPTAGAGGLSGPSIVEPFAFGKPNLSANSTPAPILTNATTGTREGQDADSVASPMSISPPPSGPEGQVPGGSTNFGVASAIKFGQPAGSVFGTGTQGFSFGSQPTPAFGSAQPAHFGNGFGTSAPSFSMPGQFQSAPPTMAQSGPTSAPQGTGPVMSMGAGMSKDDGRRKVKRKVKK